MIKKNTYRKNQFKFYLTNIKKYIFRNINSRGCVLLYLIFCVYIYNLKIFEFLEMPPKYKNTKVRVFEGSEKNIKYIFISL